VVPTSIQSPTELASSTSMTLSDSRRQSITASFFSKVGAVTGIDLRSSLGVGSSAMEKPRLTVSGPVEVGAERRSNASTMGSTWSSLIDPSVLEDIGDRERKRQVSFTLNRYFTSNRSTDCQFLGRRKVFLNSSIPNRPSFPHFN
jgi:hypothetical protein